ncbi:MAG: DNA-protecting protein DprA [Sphingobacteriales bacterium]|nr:MAG: DNA-protecting protein DprA [Sphingobacteriales bacterium]
MQMEYALLLLQHLPNTTTNTYWQLLKAFPSLEAALEANPEKLEKLLSEAAINELLSHRRQPAASELGQRVQKVLDWCQQQDIHLVSINNDAYPAVLREIPKAPALLYVKGRLQALALPQLAIVGSRSPSPNGASTARDFAHHLAAGGLAITSGLALGIDQAAHEGALNAEGATLAIMATGIDQIYPKRNQALAERIIAGGGALITEFPVGTAPQAAFFPQRNRIISGLSAGVLVVEAMVKSGSLITARYALQHNREVFAIPGSIHNPLSRGCHALIKEGAVLTESADDIFQHLAGYLSLKWQELGLPSQRATDTPSGLTLMERGELIENPAEAVVLAQLDFTPTTLDQLGERTGLPIGELLTSLLTLELKGLASSFNGGYTRMMTTSLRAPLLI